MIDFSDVATTIACNTFHVSDIGHDGEAIKLTQAIHEALSAVQREAIEECALVAEKYLLAYTQTGQLTDLIRAADDIRHGIRQLAPR